MIDVVNNEYSNTEKLEYFNNKINEIKSKFEALGCSASDLENDKMPSENTFNNLLFDGKELKRLDSLYKKYRHYNGRINSTLYWIRRGYK